MDFDGLDGPSEAPSWSRKFAPGRAAKAKPKAKTEQKQEPVENPNPTIPIDYLVPDKRESENKVDGNFGKTPQKIEPEVANGAAVKMEIDSKAENESKMEQPLDMEPSVPMEEDHHEQLMTEKEEDTLVREIDVFFSPSSDVDTKLYVVQYPFRPTWRPYELDERCQQVRVKPGTTEMEIDLTMDVHSKNYDKEKGDRLEMTKQTLATKWKPSQGTNHAVGVLIGNKIHVNCVDALVQLRPSTQVTLPHESSGPSKKQNNGLKSPAEQKEDEEEKWIPLKYNASQSEVSSRCLHNMMAKDRSLIGFNMNGDDYIDSICPGGKNRKANPDIPSLRTMLSMPLEERIKKLLCEGPPCRRFSVLKHYCPEDSNEQIFGVLQERALLIQGHWTPRTTLLKFDSSLSFARDFVLVLFSKDPIIKYSQVDAAGRYRDRIKEILKTLAKERPKLNDWKFKESTDVSFIKQFPEVVTQQEKNWKELEKNVMSIFESIKPRTDGRRNIRPRPDVAVKSEKPVDSDKGSTRNVPVKIARRTMSEETRKALPKALKKVFQTHKVCSFQLICQGLRDLAISKANNPKANSSMEVVAAFGADAPPEELQEVISQVATDIHGSYVLTSSPDHPECDPLRKVVMDLLRGSGPDAKLKKAEVFEAGRSVLSREITPTEYVKVMRDLCESKDSAWVLKKSN